MNISELIKPSQGQSNYKFLIHGMPKVGKSTLCSEAPNPLFLNFDGGLRSIKCDQIDMVGVDWNHAMEVFRELGKTNLSHQTIIFDSIDRIEEIIHQEVARKSNVKSIAQIPFGNGYKLANEQIDTFIKVLNHLWKSKHIVLICHSEQRLIQDPLYASSYDHWGLRLHKSTFAPKISEWADLIGFCHIQTSFEKEDAGFGKIRKTANAGERVLIVDEHPACLAGNRFNIKEMLPMNWKDLESAIQGDNNG